MNTLEFLASAIDSLAWPALVGFVIYILREPVGKLLDRLSRLKYKDLEAEFSQKLEEIKTIEGEVVVAEVTEDEAVETIALSELADLSPRAAIMEAWIKIEKATRGYLESVGIEHRLSYQGLRKLPEKHKQKIQHILTPYQELRLLRNKAAHSSDFDLSSEIAREYIDVSNKVERELKAATK